MLLVVCPIWALGEESEEEKEQEPRELTWDDLLPEGENVAPPVVDHSSLTWFDDYPVTTLDGSCPSSTART